MALKRISEGYDEAEKAAISKAYSEAHFQAPPPTLAEAVEVIEALIGDDSACDGHCGSTKGAGCVPADAREFLARVKGR